MRTIKKRPPPASLTHWRASRVAEQTPGFDFTYDEMRRIPQVLADVEDSLYREQGGICAYTGLKIRLKFDGNDDSREVDFHIEHVLSQDRCKLDENRGKDTAYANLLACWPRPNCGFPVHFGAVQKGDWPKKSPDDALFVSPLQEGCSRRFTFNHRGEILPANPDDEAAVETIQRLALDHKDLTAIRKRFIQGAFAPAGRQIRLGEARRLRDELDELCRQVDSGVNVELPPFVFAIRRALDREIRKLEGIASQK